MYLALRNLLQDRTRLALSMLGVALAVMLILFLMGLRAGVYQGAAAYLENAPGSVMVMPRGVKSTQAGSGQFLPAGTAETVAAIEGVARVTPVLALVVVPDLHGKKLLLRLIGYDPVLGGGPWQLAEGRAPATDDEIVLDRAIAGRHDFKLGDPFPLQGRQVTVVGFSNETISLINTFAFARKSLVESLALAPGVASFLLVTPNAGVQPTDLVDRLQSVPDSNVLLKRAVIANDRKILAQIIDQFINVMVAVAFIVGALVITMVIYAATIERRGEYGVLKAIGARNAVLFRVVIWQAMAAAGLGLVVGVGFAFLMGRLVVVLRPQLLITIAPSAIAAAVVAGLVMALIGGLTPARSVARLAPAEVFRRGW